MRVRTWPNPDSSRRAVAAGAGCAVMNFLINWSVLGAAWDKLLVRFSAAVLTPKMLFSITVITRAGVGDRL